MRLQAVLLCVLAIWAGYLPLAISDVPSTVPTAGLREGSHTAHAFTGARIVVAPDKVIERGTLVVRDGVIVAVGADIEPPADARVWRLDGRSIYAGFIDACSELSAEASKLGPSEKHGAAYWNMHVVPQIAGDARYILDAETNKKLRSQGITARLVAPSVGVIKGASALVSLGDESGSRSILKSGVALHLMLTPAQRALDNYPMSPMGALALVRQAFYDARWYADAWKCFEDEDASGGSAASRPERNDALAAMQPFVSGKSPVMFQTSDELYLLRAKQVADEFGLQAIVRGSGREYRRLEAIEAAGLPVVLPLNFPKPPRVTTPESAMSVSLERLMHWDLAPENPARLDTAGVKIAFMTHGLSDAGTFLAGVRKAVERGLSPSSALRALTQTPAELFGVSRRLGTLEPGKQASFLVCDGDLFDAKTKVLETWIDGRRYEVEGTPLAEMRGTWQLQLAGADGGSETLTLEIDGEARKLAGKIKRGDREADLSRVALEASQFSATFPGEPLGWAGIVQLSATVAEAQRAAEAKPVAEAQPAGGEAQPSEPTCLGFVVWSDGTRSSIRGKQTAAYVPPAQPAADKPAGQEQNKAALFAVNYPLGAYGVAGPPERPKSVAFQHATVWTSGPAGVLNDATLLVTDGRVAAVGSDVALPEGTTAIDLKGKHLTPGIIDCHSHVATDGGINEQAQTITAEVRIGDFIDPNDIQIYRQLAGGVTTSNILHGSANTIGGQNQVIKFRWGALADEMKFAGAPAGIKFALGENVKQSNWGDQFRLRYPQTRMGVEQLVRDAFRAARDYRRRQREWQEKPAGLPPRTDLELEGIAEVLEGKRLVHCHCYRQDEILAFLRACEEFGVKVGTLQHILEGYKLADVIARHGAGASSFSDWWAFKFEVLDAIPYNGALMRQAGVVVSFNSDDPELARRLNLEAAKAVRFGGVEPAEALKFVTLNPAIQLGIEKSVGSLEVGKDADLVVWSGPPLSSYSRCEQTWIDGRKYFDQADESPKRKEIARMRAALVQRMLASGEDPEGADDDRRELFPREDVFCEHGRDDHLGEE
ncbi:MAG TPA: amidohydrolase family protein [Pirellulales bacterium]|nr:amidohydrolase family protein [Pirellulales bacterium]